VTDDPTPLGGRGGPEAYPIDDLGKLVEQYKAEGLTEEEAKNRVYGPVFERLAVHLRERRRAREWRNLTIGLGIVLAVYLVFLAGMSAGQHYVTKCVRSHTFEDGPDSVTVCDFRVANGRQIDFGSPFAWMGIPHIPGGPYGVIGWGLVLVAVLAAMFLVNRARRASQGEASSEPR
jgi:hypothetical protein